MLAGVRLQRNRTRGVARDGGRTATRIQLGVGADAWEASLAGRIDKKDREARSPPADIVTDMLDVAMTACSNCSVVVQPADRFCNACGAPIGRAATPAAPPRYAPAAPAYAPQPPGPAAAYMAPLQTGARCQLGHEIVAGTSYCGLGHPIALDQMQFANEASGGGFAVPTPHSYAGPQPGPAYVSRPGEPAAPAQRAPADSGEPQRGYPPRALSPGPRAGYVSQPLPAPAYEKPVPQVGPRDPSSVDVAPPKVLRGFLVAYGRNPNGDFWPLTGGRHTIGRHGSQDGIEIPIQDPTVSSRHAILVVDPANGSIVVEDAGSTNGTFVNDEPIGRAGWRELRDGDRLRVGGFTTVVKVIGPI